MKQYLAIAAALTLSACGLQSTSSTPRDGYCPDCGHPDHLPFANIIWSATLVNSQDLPNNTVQQSNKSLSTPTRDLDSRGTSVVYVGSNMPIPAVQAINQQPRSILCLHELDEAPAGFIAETWAQAEVAVSQPISTTLLTQSLRTVDEICHEQFGPGWHMASNTDGPNIEGWFANGNIPTGTRFLVIDAISDPAKP